MSRCCWRIGECLCAHEKRTAQEEKPREFHRMRALALTSHILGAASGGIFVTTKNHKERKDHKGGKKAGPLPDRPHSNLSRRHRPWIPGYQVRRVGVEWNSKRHFAVLDIILSGLASLFCPAIPKRIPGRPP